MAAEGPEAPASPTRGGTEGCEGGLGPEVEAAVGPDQDVIPKPASNGAPKPEETTPVQGCNGVNMEASTPAPKPEIAKEEAPQPPAPDVVMHVALNPPVEEVSITYPLEFERYWRAAQENPLDFTAWTELLQYVEQENHIYAARKAFDSFFLRYPYCYGYWKKYADMERRFDFIKETEEVFQRGLQSIPLSMDLWIHYISFLQSSLDMNLPDSVQKISGTYESAIAAAGVDFRSDKLWEMYVEWEREQGNLKAITAIYDRVLAMPTQMYSHHWEKFKELVTSHRPQDILSTEELLWLQSKMASDTVAKTTEAEAEEAPPGEDMPLKAEPMPETGAGDGSQILGHMDQDKIRELVISIRQQIHSQNEAEVSKRWNFEEGIKRPYFHVKPLERAQLRNWRDYLDFEIASGSHERTIVLFERCVIACALYEEFWIKYTRYLENHSITGTRSVFQRACCYHLPRKPNIHLLWAAFEERQGEVEEARRILKSFEDCVPGLAMVRLRRVSLERRQGNMEGAEALLMEAIRDNEGMPVSSFYSVKLARQVLKVQKNLIKARKILLEALEKDPDNAKLYANLLEMEFSADVRQNEGNTMSSFDRALTSGLPLETKIIFSQRRVEFLEDFGSSINSLLTSYDEHQKLLNQQMMRKRLLENGSSDEADEKRMRLEETAAGGNLAVAPTTGITPLMAADVSNSGTGAYNYNTWYQNYSGYGYQNTWNYNQYYQQS
ncbi:PREDICTED: pre-mRNA-processing factor 39-like isoform X1 [Gekko japonicus]|uniref:Pre-mRNA-processing factor 39-like isoform X1 n=1 Tax=Gekko japonicus TaxID=146911 RepID=A0ABM1K117_GEKJA|nr:PREDICTED: pre-mRNA-processing factor 39-like isoform X1 [Gekko japonicus]